MNLKRGSNSMNSIKFPTDEELRKIDNTFKGKDETLPSKEELKINKEREWIW